MSEHPKGTATAGNGFADSAALLAAEGGDELVRRKQVDRGPASTRPVITSGLVRKGCGYQRSHRGSAAVNEHGAVNFNNLHTDDAGAARAFYGAVFGWTTIDAGSPMWALPGYGDHLEELNPGLRAGMKQMGAPEGFEDVVAAILPREGAPARWSVTFAVDDVDAITARARELGGSVLAGPQDAPWVRFAVLADPAGASFTASQFVAENR